VPAAGDAPNAPGVPAAGGISPVRVSDLDFDLPSDRIAQHPARRRDAARLLVVDRVTGAFEDRRFRDLPDHLSAGDLLVLNETRVLAARLVARRATGGEVEVLLTRDCGRGRWEALVRPGRRVRAGDVLSFAPSLEARVLAQLADGGRLLGFQDAQGRPRNGIARELRMLGRVPLPPYIRREPTPADRRRYQTLYAREPGAVAAPTAGLHFTAATFDALARRGVRRARICLHVGPGTFRPVEVDDPAAHRMDAERFAIGGRAAAALSSARTRGARICCVGTTTVRALETAAGLWAPDESARGTAAGRRLATIASAATGLRPRPVAGDTDLFIRPPFDFRLTDALLTNFHLPRSTLLLLVAAFAGVDLTRAAYRHAVRSGYRFYSYGDAMLIL
jgi:S-adenosylmethionine:tRNA ribosyltransferase-isomerase